MMPWWQNDILGGINLHQVYPDCVGNQGILSTIYYPWLNSSLPD